MRIFKRQRPQCQCPSGPHRNCPCQAAGQEQAPPVCSAHGIEREQGIEAAMDAVDSGSASWQRGA